MGFAADIDLRFHSADQLLQTLEEISAPPAQHRIPNRIEEEFAKLVQLQALAEVQMRDKIRDSRMVASRALLDRLCELAIQKNLSSGRANPYMPDPNSVRFEYKLSYVFGDFLVTTVVHYVRLVAPSKSFVEAAFRFTDGPIPSEFPVPYYQGPATDTRRLKNEVRGKADEIFAEALRHLRERHEQALGPQ